MLFCWFVPGAMERQGPVAAWAPQALDAILAWSWASEH